MAMELKGLNKQSWSFKQNDSEETDSCQLYTN